MEDIKVNELPEVVTETFDWESSTIKSTTYDFSKEELTVEFKSGGIYRYKEIRQSEYKKFLEAESKGKQFSSEFRNKKDFEKL